MNTTPGTLLSAALLVFCLSGCQDTTNAPDGSAPVSDLPPDTVDSHGHDHGHDHPSEGPHHGDLVELGNEEYHGEVVHDHEGGGLTIYILDGSAKKQVSIDATELTINVSHDGKPEQFTLTAKPDDGDEEGRSSRFVSDDAELSAHLDEEGANPRMVVKINGKAYRGEIHHDHEGHDHGDGAHDHDHDKE